MNPDGSDTAQRFRETPRGEVLRGFVTERLAAASREILAAVDRLVSGYEEEASGFQREIERQRTQLEALQPPSASTRVGGNCSRGFVHVEEKQEDAHVYAENTKGVDTNTPRRSRLGERKSEKPRTSKSQKYVHLKICILEDSHTGLLSKNVLKKCPVLELKCPRGLQEAAFLDLLRTNVPQLAGDNKRFDIFTSNKRQRLQRLRLKRVTPEEIQSHISCSDLGRSTLYIQLKAQKEPQFNEKENPLLQTQELDNKDFLSTATTLMYDENRPNTSSPVQEVDCSKVAIQSSSSTSDQQDMETDEADSVEQEPAEDAVTEVERDQTHGFQVNAVKKQKSRHSCSKATETQSETSNNVLSCKVCGERHRLEVNIVKHAWSHMDESGSTCGVCGVKSESADALKDHLENQHKTENCHLCGESFLSAPSLSEHVAAHSGDGPHECDVRHDEFSVKHHQKPHGTIKTHECYTCHEVFELKEQLNAHYRTHVNKKGHLCGVCGKSLSDYRSLSRHKFTHTGERPHSCQVCGRRFKLIGALRQHEKTHTDRERSYLCDVCCKMFLTSKQLQIHMRTHTNEKPYHCSQCGKGFTTRGPLTIHMRVHTGETPYRCPDCGWSFKRKSNLDDHLTVHSGVKAFVCSICGKGCARKTHLNVHMRTHNGERPYKCGVCDKAFTQSHCLKTHMKSHERGEAQVQH